MYWSTEKRGNHNNNCGPVVPLYCHAKGSRSYIYRYIYCWRQILTVCHFGYRRCLQTPLPNVLSVSLGLSPVVFSFFCLYFSVSLWLLRKSFRTEVKQTPQPIATVGYIYIYIVITCFVMWKNREYLFGSPERTLIHFLAQNKMKH